jgi:hypothetical protein
MMENDAGPYNRKTAEGFPGSMGWHHKNTG